MNWRIVFLTMAVFCVLSPFAKGVAFAAISESDAVRALVGEAAGQGNDEVLAHACALRNRGTLKGVFGYRAKHVDREPAWVFERARAAWRKAHAFDVVAGRTEWRSLYDFKLMKRRGQTPESQGLEGGLLVGETWFYYLKGK